MDLYLKFSAELPTPKVFRQWAAIHGVGAAAERRVWTQFGKLRLHPNLFVFLVGPPGVGKTVALNPMGEILRKSGAVTIAPNDITKQGLLDALAKSTKGVMHNERPFDYSFLALHIAELSNFMSKYDDALAGLLTDLFDCPPVNEEQKRGQGDKSVVINNPGISFVIGTATQNLGNTIAEEMWSSGFMARVIMVYSADKIIPVDMFAEVDVEEKVREELECGLRRVGEFKGPMMWLPSARALLQSFRTSGDADAPLHNRLTHYVTRRWMHLAKLCMVAALSDERMVVNPEDFHQALAWLLAAEADMPEIFKDMVSHADGQIHEELKNWMFNAHMKSNRKPIPAGLLYAFLAPKIASHTIPNIIAVAEAAGYISRVAGTEPGPNAYYVPGPHGNDRITNLGVL